MPLFYRLLICLVVATPLSAVYFGSYASTSATGGLAFTLDIMTAASFVGTSLICVLLCSIGSSAATTSSSATSSTGSDKKRKTKRVGKGRETGTVKWFNGGKGFGFITREDNSEIFVHFRSVQKNNRRLAPGLAVEFEVVEGEKGLEASDVSVI